MEQGTEIANLDSMDAIVAAFNNDDMEAFMEASGQGGNTNRQVGLPRLNINYDTETEDGQTLPRGSWKMYLDGKFIYAEKVSVRFILRMFAISVPCSIILMLLCTRVTNCILQIYYFQVKPILTYF